MHLIRLIFRNVVTLGICLLVWRMVSLFLISDVQRWLDWILGEAPDIVDWWDLVYFFLFGIVACFIAAQVARYRNRTKSLFLAFVPPIIIVILSHELLYSTDWDVIWPFASIAYVIAQIISYLAGYYWHSDMLNNKRTKP